VLHLAVQLFSWHGNAESLRPRFMQLRAEEVELRDRVSVLRTSGGGKANVGIIPLHTGRTLPVLRSWTSLIPRQNFQPFLHGIMIEKIRALRKSLETTGSRAAPVPAQTSLGEFSLGKR